MTSSAYSIHVIGRAVVATDTSLSTVDPCRSLLSRQGALSVDTVTLACRQSKIRDCHDTVDDRVSTTALVIGVTHPAHEMVSSC